MSLFGNQILRLLREKWPNATMLAEELFAILQGNIPLTQDAPITITTEGEDEAPLILRPGGDVAIEINRPDGTTVQIHKDGRVTPTPEDEEEEEEEPETPIVGANVFPGEVVSGSGNTYLVDLYENGPSSPSTKTVTVTQLQIHEDSDVPAGTWVMVALNGSQYSMQVPVWVD